MAVVTCEDYICSDGYEYKDNYGSVTCTGDCDDDQCCDLGGFSLSRRCTITTYACILLLTTHTITRFAVSYFPCDKKAIVLAIRRSMHTASTISVLRMVRFDNIPIFSTI